MLPLLFSLGPLKLHTLNLFLVLAFLSVAFLFWRKGREEHYEESQLFDGFLLSTLFGLVAGRVGFILLHLAEVGTQPLKWLDVISYPGVNLFVGLLGAGIYMYRFALKQKWDVYEIMDFWVLAVSFGLGLMWVGLFFDGSSFGNPTQLPWGLVFPGVFDKHHPVQAYFALFFFVLSWYLNWVEYRYRTFTWYRAGKNTAQTGFLTSVFIIGLGIFSFVVAWLRPAQFTVNGWSLDPLIYLLITGVGIWLLWKRSGRALPGLGGRRGHHK